MKNMYAVKCLYQFQYFTLDGKLIDDASPCWEDRIILIRASNMDDADLKCEKIAKEYEDEYINTRNQVVKIKLYSVIDIFATYDTNARTNIEVYSKMFDATEQEIEKMLDVEYPLKK